MYISNKLKLLLQQSNRGDPKSARKTNSEVIAELTNTTDNGRGGEKIEKEVCGMQTGNEHCEWRL